MLPRKFRVLNVKRTRVRFLLGDANFGQILNQDLGLDLEFAGQFVDADLLGFCHQPLFFLFRSSEFLLLSLDTWDSLFALCRLTLDRLLGIPGLGGFCGIHF